jgi:hypothetical protein
MLVLAAWPSHTGGSQEANYSSLESNTGKYPSYMHGFSRVKEIQAVLTRHGIEYDGRPFSPIPRLRMRIMVRRPEIVKI